jgi:hypothetical protein
LKSHFKSTFIDLIVFCFNLNLKNCKREQNYFSEEPFGIT